MTSRPPRRPVRVLVVDDSPLFVHGVSGALEEGGMMVIGVASDGDEAVTKAIALAPDVIIMDATMPRLDGLAAVERIMATAPVPIIVVTADAARAPRMVFDALQRGALDAVAKPNLVDATTRRAFIDHVELLASVRAVHHPAFPLRAATATAGSSASSEAAASVFARESAEMDVEVIAIAASTGGPSALAKVLTASSSASSSASLGCPVVVVQHMDAEFAPGFAKWLGEATGRRVRLASPGLLAPGEIVVAPADAHLVVERRGADGRNVHVALDRRSAPVDGHRPSATVLFRSVADAFAARAVGVVLTGMGRDGADGLRAMKERGAQCLVEDGSTAVVDGMPRAAREIGAATVALPLDGIAAAVARIWSASASRHEGHREGHRAR